MFGVRRLAAWMRGAPPPGVDDATLARAEAAAEWIAGLATERSGRVVVVAHTTFRLLMAHALERRGWRGPERRPYHEWSAWRYTLEYAPPPNGGRMTTSASSADGSHPAAVERIELLDTLRFHLVMGAVWLAVAVGSSLVAWRFWPEAIRVRMPSVVLFLIGQAAIVWGIIQATGRLSGLRWLVLGGVLNVAALVVAVMRGAPLLRPQGWHAGLVVLIVAIGLAASMGAEHLGRVAATVRRLRDARRRLTLDADVEDRPRRVFDALDAMRRDWNIQVDVPRLARISFFGDPVAAPRRVVVWGVFERGRIEEWAATAEGQGVVSRLIRSIDRALRDVGYPTTVEVGVAAAADVDAAGGEGAYFGADGRRRPRAPRS